ncbi:hypothetical protein WICPIJ_010062 [Wickerhamomyces pijperi]|uniref:Uncharacterized protein n=1 Tax=Wickerhamomyces pijperi TaxID=599730 RepID=A0A9P8PHV2_WICPI|nr:hypothetical protein WICPIJ_010062 [Wickerhamomyces pijperi]
MKGNIFFERVFTERRSTSIGFVDSAEVLVAFPLASTPWMSVPFAGAVLAKMSSSSDSDSDSSSTFLALLAVAAFSAASLISFWIFSICSRRALTRAWNWAKSSFLSGSSRFILICKVPSNPMTFPSSTAAAAVVLLLLLLVVVLLTHASYSWWPTVPMLGLSVSTTEVFGSEQSSLRASSAREPVSKAAPEAKTTLAPCLLIKSIGSMTSTLEESNGILSFVSHCFIT